MTTKTFTIFALTSASLLLNAQADITTGLVGYWHLSDGPGSSTAADSSGNGNLGTLTDFSDATFLSMWTTNSDPTNGWPYALLFNTNGATSNYVSVPNSASLNVSVTKAFTLSAWVYCSVAGTNQSNGACIICKGISGNEAYCLDITSNGFFRVSMRNSSGNSIMSAISSVSPAAGTWYHVAGTYTNAGQPHEILYVNAVSTGTSAGTLTTILSNATVVSIGCRASTNGVYNLPFQGIIDEAHIYDRTLSASDIMQLYTNEAFSIANSGIGYWNGLSGSGGSAQLNTTSTNFCGNADNAPLQNDTLPQLQAAESGASQPNACYFADAYYVNGNPIAVASTNLTLPPGGLAIGTATAAGTITFLNSTATYSLSSSDNHGLMDGANPTLLSSSGSKVTLTGTNTFSGGTTINAGTLQVGNGSGGPATGSPLGSGPVTNDSSLVFDANDSPPAFSNIISGIGTVAIAGSGTLILSGANTYTGDTALNAGTLSVSTIADSPTNSAIGYGSVIFSGGTLAYTGSSNAGTSRVLSGAGGTTSTIDVPPGISLELTGQFKSSTAFTVNKTDAGTLILSGTGDNSFLGMNVNGGTMILNKASSVSPSVHALGEPTSVGNGGTLQLSGTGGAEIYSNARVTVTINGGGVFDLNGQNNSLSLLSLSGTGNGNDNFGGVLINSATNTTSTLNSAVTLAANSTLGGSGFISLPGVISGPGISLTYAGTGTLQLGSSNAYTGGTTNSSSGTLDAQVSGSIPGNVTVTAGTLEMDSSSAMSSGATLSVSGGGSVNLTYSGTQFINALFVNGTQQASGVYGAGTTNNPSNVFSGGGDLFVGTLPPITILLPTISSDQLTISWTSVSGGSYNVYATTNLSPPVTWTNLNPSPIIASGSNTSYIVPGFVSDQPQLFLQIRQ